jgi:hypothetical protein
MMAAMERFDNSPEGQAMFSESLEDGAGVL